MLYGCKNLVIIRDLKKQTESGSNKVYTSHKAKIKAVQFAENGSDIASGGIQIHTIFGVR